VSSRTGAVFLPWLFICLMLASLFWLLNRLNQGVHHRETCREQMEKIYQALRHYEQEHGRLPALELYPVNPEENEETLWNLLSDQPGFQKEWLICPSAPEVLREQGITYLWNTELNQSSLADRDTITWVLVDMQALDDGLPGPHFGKVHILYSDGRVEQSTHPPPNLPVRF
jgi:hypothetical protein